MSADLKWESVVSSHVDAFAELPDEAAVLIQYRNGSIYKFPADSEEVAGLRTASSVGRYINLMFKGRGMRVS